jgi:transposase
MTCLDCEKLLERVEKLEKENEWLKSQLKELERRLALYENAHAPPSQRRYPTRRNGGSPRGGKRFPGAPKGHPGTTRPTPKPDVVTQAEWSQCPRCGADLGKPACVNRRIVEDIPEPQPVVVKEFLEFEGDCPRCGTHVISRHPDCPPEGRLGKNLLV